MSNILKLVLTDHWFEEIKSGRKTHEYRMATIYWKKRLMNINHINENFCRISKGIPKESGAYDFYYKKYGLAADRLKNRPALPGKRF